MATSTALKNAKGNESAFQEIVDRRRHSRMNEIDNLTPEQRECVHLYGWNTVKALLDLNVTKAKHIRHIVETILNEFSPTRGSSSAQGTRAHGGEK